ncbi:MAG: HAMP domain-containing histidine kinase [Chitinophagaceae bacterium]|nr:MAG: HAMP domain-containing histidine kinase [Chitinophagaceae bacterium]
MHLSHHRIILFFFLAFFVLPFTGRAQLQGQPLIDSLVAALPSMNEDSNKVKSLSRISQVYYQVNIMQSFPYVKEGLVLAEKIKWKKGIANLNNNLGLYTSDTGNYTVGNEHYKKSLEINTELGAKNNQINNLNNLGRNYQFLADYTTAATYLFQALAIAREIKSDDHISLVATNLASCFFNQKNYPKQLEYAELTFVHAKRAKNYSNMVNALMNFANVSLASKDTVKTKDWLQQALAIAEDNSLYGDMAKVMVNLSVLVVPDYKKAIDLMLRADTIISQISPGTETDLYNKLNLAENYFQLTRVHSGAVKSGYLAESARWLAAAKELLLEDRPGMMVNILALESDLAEDRGDYRQALTAFRRSAALNDSLFSQEKKNDIAELEGKHNLAIKDNEIAINWLTLANQRKTQWGLVAGLALLLAVGILLYRQSRIRKRNNQALTLLNNKLDEANKVKARFFSILSHDLRSPVVRLIHFLQLQKENPDLLNAEQAIRHQQKISNSAENLVATMEAMLLWSKEQMENFQPQIREVEVAGLFSYLEDYFGDTGNTQLSYSAAPALRVRTDEDYLRTIMQNLTANAIAALDNKPGASIHWKAWAENGKTMLSITDNGPGMSAAKARAIFEKTVSANSRSGLGMHLVRDLSAAIGLKVSVDSKPGEGTVFLLES